MPYKPRLVLTAALLIALVGCAGGPGIGSRRAPDWVLEPPEANSQYEYFVVSASSDGDVAEAEEAAGYALLSRINQALGVEITVETSAEARASLEGYEADLVQQVTQSGSGQIAGLRIPDRYVSRDGDSVTVHLLGQYERRAFEAERAARASLLRQQEELLTGPERTGDELIASGRLTQGITQLTQAAVAASASTVRIAPVVLERSLQKAVEAALRLELSGESAPVAVPRGQEPDEPFVFRVADNRGQPVPGVPIEISYTEARGSRDVVRAVSRMTDDSGTVRFVHPATDRVGEFTVSARLDVQPTISMLDSLPDSVRTQADAVVAALVNVRAVLRSVVLSQARSIPTAIVVVDIDAAGAIMPGERVAGGIIETLTNAGFQLHSATVDPAGLLSLTPAAAPAYFRNTVNADVLRVVYGSAEIVETREEDGVLVKVSGTLTAVDLQSGEVLYRTSGIKNARSRTAERAVSTAFAELGRELGADLAANLP